MSLRVVSIDPTHPRERHVAEAVDALASGGIVALPTETFYGLAVDSANTDALTRLNRLKGKSANEPILLLLSDTAQADGLSDRIPAAFQLLAERFWPGPLSLVIPAGDTLPREVTGGRGTVGVRVPGLALPRMIAAAIGRPISGVSANLNGRPPARTAVAVARAFPEGLALILDGGPAPGGAPSTLLDLCGSRPRVLREGVLPLEALERLLPTRL